MEALNDNAYAELPALRKPDLPRAPKTLDLRKVKDPAKRKAKQVAYDKLLAEYNEKKREYDEVLYPAYEKAYQRAYNKGGQRKRQREREQQERLEEGRLKSERWSALQRQRAEEWRHEDRPRMKEGDFASPTLLEMGGGVLPAGVSIEHARQVDALWSKRQSLCTARTLPPAAPPAPLPESVMPPQLLDVVRQMYDSIGWLNAEKLRAELDSRRNELVETREGKKWLRVPSRWFKKLPEELRTDTMRLSRLLPTALRFVTRERKAADQPVHHHKWCLSGGKAARAARYR